MPNWMPNYPILFNKVSESKVGFVVMATSTTLTKLFLVCCTSWTNSSSFNLKMVLLFHHQHVCSLLYHSLSVLLSTLHPLYGILLSVFTFMDRLLSDRPAHVEIQSSVDRTPVYWSHKMESQRKRETDRERGQQNDVSFVIAHGCWLFAFFLIRGKRPIHILLSFYIQYVSCRCSASSMVFSFWVFLALSSLKMNVSMCVDPWSSPSFRISDYLFVVRSSISVVLLFDSLILILFDSFAFDCQTCVV